MTEEEKWILISTASLLENFVYMNSTGEFMNAITDDLCRQKYASISLWLNREGHGLLRLLPHWECI